MLGVPIAGRKIVMTSRLTALMEVATPLEG